MRTCLYSFTIHFLLTEVLRHVVPLELQSTVALGGTTDCASR